MLKQLIILFNFISFIVITALLPADIKIDTRIPEKSEFVIDSTYIIEVSIKKGEIFGFAKFQQNVPAGFVAHPVETAEASFTFADGKVKFIWMAIPESDVVNVSYALIASSEADPNGFLEGSFSYIEDNERKKYDIPAIPISVISDKPIVEKIPAQAVVSRSVTDLGNNEYQVNLSIDKQGIQGFAKVEEYLPDGAEATVMENNKAVFSQVDERAKFVWMAVPEDKNLTVSYKVKSTEDIATSLAGMQGNFSFLDESETKTVAIVSSAGMPVAVEEATEPDEPAETPTVPEPEVAVAEVNEEEQQPMPVAALEESDDETPMEVEEKEVEPIVAEKPKAQPVTSVPSPENGVSYKVQVVAGHKVVSEKYLRDHYKFKDPYNVENHEGWVKYTTGQFDIYKGARDKREQLASAGHQFPGPFVTAYNSGERITVQEALMISNQKWFK